MHPALSVVEKEERELECRCMCLCAGKLYYIDHGGDLHRLDLGPGQDCAELLLSAKSVLEGGALSLDEVCSICVSEDVAFVGTGNAGKTALIGIEDKRLLAVLAGSVVHVLGSRVLLKRGREHLVVDASDPARAAHVVAEAGAAPGSLFLIGRSDYVQTSFRQSAIHSARGRIALPLARIESVSASGAGACEVFLVSNGKTLLVLDSEYDIVGHFRGVGLEGVGMIDRSAYFGTDAGAHALVVCSAGRRTHLVQIEEGARVWTDNKHIVIFGGARARIFECFS